MGFIYLVDETNFMLISSCHFFLYQPYGPEHWADVVSVDVVSVLQWIHTHTHTHTHTSRLFRFTPKKTLPYYSKQLIIRVIVWKLLSINQSLLLHLDI